LADEQFGSRLMFDLVVGYDILTWL